MTSATFSKPLLLISSLCCGLPAYAESRAVSDAGNAGGKLSGSVRLDFRVIIPKVLFLRVGTGTEFADNATVDRIDFNVPATDVGSGAVVAGASGPVYARVLGNNKTVSFTASGTAGGLVNAADAGAPAIPWTQVMPGVASGSLPHPAIGNGAAGAASSLSAVGNVVDKAATWNFNYRNSMALPEGSYNGRVTYTAALP